MNDLRNWGVSGFCYLSGVIFTNARGIYRLVAGARDWFGDTWKEFKFYKNIWEALKFKFWNFKNIGNN